MKAMSPLVPDDASSFTGRRVLIAVCGGISAYKICGLVSTLTQQGAEVRVAMTSMATRFVGPLSFEALCGHPVILEVEGQGERAMEHIESARWAEVLLVAPCTADMLAKLAMGLGDDIISALSLAFAGPQVLAPAMNPVMWAKPSLQRNIKTLSQDGFTVIPPEEGLMACGDTGVGRLPNEDVLLNALSEALA
jgi:phosphopantothenoylcysteine decarboxylase/phosphopantothenate--cysteine ligase